MQRRVQLLEVNGINTAIVNTTDQNSSKEKVLQDEQEDFNLNAVTKNLILLSRFYCNFGTNFLELADGSIIATFPCQSVPNNLLQEIHTLQENGMIFADIIDRLVPCGYSYHYWNPSKLVCTIYNVN